LPCPDDLKPPCGISATSGMWVLIHTQPKSSALDIRIAVETSLVQTDEARANSTPLAFSSASSSSVKDCTVMTGPKISVWIIRSSCSNPPTTVGSM
jgi:hypothetical protein